MARYLIALTLICSLTFTSAALAVPTLQVGAPGGTGEGTYANYIGNLTNPTEEDTAVTFGNTLYVAGAYSTKDPELLLGGKYSGGENWSNFGFSTAFNSHGAVLMATVPDGSLTASGGLPVGAVFTITYGTTTLNPFYGTTVYESGFKVPNPPSNHDPIKNQDYLFFDIGDFTKSVYIPNFDGEVASNQLGEIKTLILNITGFSWVHFDAFALMTDSQGSTKFKTTLDTDLEGNPGSKDVTWKESSPPQSVPEPGTIILLGSGLVGLGLYGRRKFRK